METATAMMGNPNPSPNQKELKRTQPKPPRLHYHALTPTYLAVRKTIVLVRQCPPLVPQSLKMSYRVPHQASAILRQKRKKIFGAEISVQWSDYKREG